MRNNIHIKFNDYILENSRYIIDEHFFSTDKYDYKISILKNDSEPNYPYFGFKAKSKGSRDFHYDQSIITNDNFYLVMKEILNYLNSYTNNNID